MQNITLSEEQQQAFNYCLETLDNRKRLFIITGKPGTGKTTMAFHLINHLTYDRSLDIALCAPTGRAAKRLSEKSGRHASTIHRLLQWDPITKGFVHGIQNPLPNNCIVCDEASMIDIFLFNSLLKALRKDAILILVGDPYQLPPVGPGAPFRDLIDSREVPFYLLNKIHRQARDSNIIKAAHGILDGDNTAIQWDGSSTDFQLIDLKQKLGIKQHHDLPESKIIDYIETELANVPHFYKLQTNEAQVLCPQRKSDIGTNVLNKKFQEVFNPPSSSKSEHKKGDTTFRENDRVIQTRNNYDLGIFNGDVGNIAEIRKPSKDDDTVMRIKFDDIDPLINLKSENIYNIDLAYALTVHKMQGNEMPLVIIPAHRSNIWMWRRPLLYTAVTRAQKYCIIVGDMGVVADAVVDNREDERRTRLKERLVV